MLRLRRRRQRVQFHHARRRADLSRSGALTREKIRRDDSRARRRGAGGGRARSDAQGERGGRRIFRARAVEHDRRRDGARLPEGARDQRRDGARVHDWIRAEPAELAGEGAGKARTARRRGQGRAGKKRRQRRVRHVSRARDVPDTRCAGPGDRIRGASARRAPAQIHQLARVAALFESADAVRAVRSAAGDFVERVVGKRSRDPGRRLLRRDCAVAGGVQGSRRRDAARR